MQTHPHTLATAVAVGKKWCPDFSPLLHLWKWAARNRWSQCGAPSNTHTHTHTHTHTLLYGTVWKIRQMEWNTAPSSPSWAWHCTEKDTKGQERIAPRSLLYIINTILMIMSYSTASNVNEVFKYPHCTHKKTSQYDNSSISTFWATV